MARHLEHLVAAFATLLLGCLVPSVGSAQNITTDGSLGAKKTLPGPNYPITADLGKQVGTNLFHSFGIFGLDKGETATFSGPNTVTNVIGRVTGGTASSINGKIDSSSLAGANLYLINPSGIIFGPNATVNVAGSFHAATADYLRLSDGAKFQATNPSGSTLSAAPPAAFGFLTATSPAITVNGSQLGVTAAGATVGVVGGPVTINNGATLSAPAGTIHVTSVAGAGEVPVDPANSSAFTVTSFGPVSITGSAKLDVSDPKGLGSGGSVFIRAGSLTIDGGIVSTGTAGNTPASAGNVDVIAGSLSLTNGGEILAPTYGSGDAGTVTVRAGTMSISNGAVITTAAASGSTGNAGNVTITAGTLSITSSGAIVSSTSGPGHGGDVSATVAGALTIDGTSENPHAGTDIQAGALSSTGNAGNVTITAGTLSISNGGLIFSPTFGAGHAGNVSATVAGALTIEAISGPLQSSLGTGIITAALPRSTGNAGNVTIAAETLSIVGNSGIGSGTYGAGNGGNVFVNVAGKVTIDGAGVAVNIASGSPPLTGISADALTTALTPSSIPPLSGFVTAAWPGSTGSAGNISITAGALSITENGLIFSPTFGPGNGGDVSASVAGALTIDGRSLSSPVALLQTGALSGTTGNAGNITIKATELSITDNGVISSHALTANGGDIAISVRDLLYLRQGEITTQVDASTGNGGNIIIDGGAVVLDRGRITAAALGSGLNGNIDVRADPFIVSAGSTITATGLITFVNPPTDLSSALVVLSGELRRAAEVLRDSCAAHSALPRSTLTEAGRGGLPQDPEATIPALYLAGRDVEPALPTDATAAPAHATRQSSLRLTMHCGD